MSLLNPDLQVPAQAGPPAETFHRVPAVKRRYGGISTSTLYRWIDNGTFPAPERLGPGCVAWRESVLRQYDENPEGWAAKNQQEADA